jgi:hypothetical protein
MEERHQPMVGNFQWRGTETSAEVAGVFKREALVPLIPGTCESGCNFFKQEELEESRKQLQERNEKISELKDSLAQKQAVRTFIPLFWTFSHSNPLPCVQPALKTSIWLQDLKIFEDKVETLKAMEQKASASLRIAKVPHSRFLTCCSRP